MSATSLVTFDEGIRPFAVGWYQGHIWAWVTFPVEGQNLLPAAPAAECAE
jgi:hypothetical protein